ncbi:MAG: hypothetical protein JO127_01640 [Caulobacteraceae bacterium]|nr:hypothetical protein [Caulobacteraceae bacterium]
MDAEAGIRIYRGVEAPALLDTDCLTLVPGDELQTRGSEKLREAGFGEGSEARVLVNMPGFSLVYLWFKENFPLPLHSHEVDCLYHVVAGSLELGNETLGPRDCFFVPADVPYAYRAGPRGVEVLEFRHATQFEYRHHVRNSAFYDKAEKTVAANLDAWRGAKRPSEHT